MREIVDQSMRQNLGLCCVVIVCVFFTEMRYCVQFCDLIFLRARRSVNRTHASLLFADPPARECNFPEGEN
jgi:hypothetical protein